jgi:hypothetical protein
VRRWCGVNPDLYCENANFNGTAPCCAQPRLAQQCGPISNFQQANITRIG